MKTQHIPADRPGLRRLEPGHWITLAGMAAQAVAVIAVVVWRVGAVERRIETLDDRIWTLTRSTRVASPAALWSPCAQDATRITLTTTGEKP